MSDASLTIADLAARLATVATVRTGRAALETTSATWPVITLWSTKDILSADQSMATRTLMLEYKTNADDFPGTLDTALSAIRAVLRSGVIDGMPFSAYAASIRQSNATFFMPADNGGIAILQVEIDFDYYP